MGNCVGEVPSEQCDGQPTLAKAQGWGNLSIYEVTEGGPAPEGLPMRDLCILPLAANTRRHREAPAFSIHLSGRDERCSKPNPRDARPIRA